MIPPAPWPTKAAKPGLFPVTEDLFAKSSSLRGRTMKLLKWGPSRVRVKSAKVPLTSYTSRTPGRKTSMQPTTPPPYELRHVTASTLL